MLRCQRKASITYRAGLTLAEVLVSMGIMTIGLLGVASLFPVGGHYMQQGEIADTANAIAQAALDDAIIRGHLNPENWVVLDIDNLKFTDPSTPNRPGTTPAQVNVSRFTDALEGAMHFRTLSTPTANAMRSLGGLYLDGFYGAAFIIDPLGMASGLAVDDTSAAPHENREQTIPRRRFPAFITASGNTYEANQLNLPSWRPWDLSTAQSTFRSWPIRRITTSIAIQDWNNSSFRTMLPAARKLFTANDDLALTLPNDSDSPARQRLETWQNSSNGNAIQPASRQAGGNYSWIISVSPGSSEARDALAMQPDAYQYDVSVVVFHKRVLGEGFEGALEAERLVNAKVVTTGTSGGELLLEKRPSENSDPYASFPSPFEELRSGEYVMVTGPHPLSSNRRPMLFSQWYRVQSIEDSGSTNLQGASQTLDREGRVLVSLRGPDWPWQETSDLNDNTLLSNDLRVTIVPGAVAVHTKSMRLESGVSWGE